MNVNNQPFPSNTEIINKFILNCHLNINFNKNYHCTELIGYILSTILKLVTFNKKNVCLTPNDFIDIPNYSKIYQIKK
jgi:hypothetical protein